MAHPWVLELRPGSPPVSPNLLGWTDLGMQVVLRTGLPEQEAAAVLLMVDGYVRSHVGLGLQFAGRDASTSWGDQLRAVVDAEELPGLARVLAAGALDDDEPGEFPGEQFTLGLVVLLNGIAVLAGG